MDLLMVRDREARRFVYVEQLSRMTGESPWEYVRRSVRREAQIKARFATGQFQVLVGWGVSSVEEFLETYPEYGPVETSKSERLSGGGNDQRGSG